MTVLLVSGTSRSPLRTAEHYDGSFQNTATVNAREGSRPRLRSTAAAAAARASGVGRQSD
jgi:hypothetical protein